MLECRSADWNGTKGESSRVVVMYRKRIRDSTILESCFPEQNIVLVECNRGGFWNRRFRGKCFRDEAEVAQSDRCCVRVGALNRLDDVLGKYIARNVDR